MADLGFSNLEFMDKSSRLTLKIHYIAFLGQNSVLLKCGSNNTRFVTLDICAVR
jgi:hypothetical protein